MADNDTQGAGPIEISIVPPPLPYVDIPVWRQAESL